MIAYLRGAFVEATDDSVIVDIQGVGYEAFVTQRALMNMPDPGGSILLYTHDHVRADERALFGFLRRKERAIFQDLIGVSGVGARSALAALSVLTPEEMVSAVQSGDVAAIARAKGIGKKTAQRVILDLQNKWGAIEPMDLRASHLQGEVGDAVKAMVALGAEEMEAEKAVREARRSLGEDASVDALVRAALQARSKASGTK